MNQLIYIIILVFSVVSLQGYSQCNVKTNNRSDGVSVRYLNPEFVGTGTGCELGVSISTNGTDYFFNTTIRYIRNSVKSSGTLMLSLRNDQSLNLKLYQCELATTNNSEVALSVYYLTKTDVERLRTSQIEILNFRESDGKIQIITLSKNYDVALRQINCLNN